MNRSNIVRLASTLFATLILFFAISCGTSKKTTESELGDLGSLQVEKSGAVLWGEHCNRCHIAPDPSAFSDVQWEAIGTHMRIRAGIPAEEARKIITFLQQSN